MIARRYLTGYSFDGKILSPLSPRTVERVGKCRTAGGNPSVTEKGATCPYCGAQYIER